VKQVLAQELAQLALLAEACDKRHDFHARRGALLLSAGEYSEAASALEKALLLNPDLAGTQLDYAQALARAGQRAGALGLVEQVAQRPDIEPGLRQWLEQEVRQAAPRAPGGLGEVSREARGLAPSALFAQEKPVGLSWSAMLQSSVGRESNLASASHTRELTLYLLGGPVQVTLADNPIPQAGLALRLSGGVQAAIATGLGEMRASAFVQRRIAQPQGVPEQQFARAEISLSHTLGPGQVQWLAVQQSLRQGELYGANDLSFLVDYAPGLRAGPCLGAGAIGQADQRYAQAANMAGRYSFRRLELRCAMAGEWRIGRLVGLDRAALADRPGGDKRRADIYLRHERPLRIALPRAESSTEAAGRLSVWARRGTSADDRVLSELLGPAATETRREDIGAGLWWRVGERWQWGIDVEKNTQRSTNPLLNINNLSIYSGVRWQIE